MNPRDILFHLSEWHIQLICLLQISLSCQRWQLLSHEACTESLWIWHILGQTAHWTSNYRIILNRFFFLYASFRCKHNHILFVYSLPRSLSKTESLFLPLEHCKIYCLCMCVDKIIAMLFLLQYISKSLTVSTWQLDVFLYVTWLIA